MILLSLEQWLGVQMESGLRILFGLVVSLLLFVACRLSYALPSGPKSWKGHVFWILLLEEAACQAVRAAYLCMERLAEIHGPERAGQVAVSVVVTGLLVLVSVRLVRTRQARLDRLREQALLPVYARAVEPRPVLALSAGAGGETQSVPSDAQNEGGRHRIRRSGSSSPRRARARHAGPDPPKRASSLEEAPPAPPEPGLPSAASLPGEAPPAAVTAYDSDSNPPRVEWATRSEPDPRLLALASRAGPTLPDLPGFREAVEGDREQQFRTLGYTFWNREMVDALSAQMKRLVGSASGSGWWLELAAGTGRLAAELARSGVPVLATDDGSQEDARVGSGHRRVRCGTWVLRCSLREAVARFRPERVLVTWPPLGSGVTLDLLAGRLPGGEGVRVLVVIGERDGASELPPDPSLLPPGWTGERLPDVEQWLVGFLDPDGEAGRGEVWVYQRSELGEA